MGESSDPQVKILFLDFDGPMIPLRAWPLTDKLSNERFDPVAAGTLKKLFDRNPDIQLVISSSWRSIGKEKIVAILEREGISRAHLHDDWETKNLENHLMANRHLEINEWLGRHPEITTWVAIDDYPLTLPEKHFVKVSSNDGMLWEHQRQLFKKLGATGCGF